MPIGCYVRVSTADQSLDRQLEPPASTHSESSISPWSRAVERAWWMTVRRSVPYLLAGLGLLGGLRVLLSGPLPSRTLNTLGGGAFLATAVVSVTYLIVDVNSPDERGPDF